MGSREDVAARIDADTKVKIEEMNKAVSVNKQAVIDQILELVYDIKPELHKNFKAVAVASKEWFKCVIVFFFPFFNSI